MLSSSSAAETEGDVIVPCQLSHTMQLQVGASPEPPSHSTPTSAASGLYSSASPVDCTPNPERPQTTERADDAASFVTPEPQPALEEAVDSDASLDAQQTPQEVWLQL